MSPNRRASACLLALIALAGMGCSDETSSTAPAVRSEAAPALSVARPRPRGISISALQLSSTEIPITSSDVITPFTVTVTNPGPKDVAAIYLEGELQPSMNNQPPVTTFIAACPNPTGVVPRGDCTMTGWTAAQWPLYSPGPGTFTLRLVQLQADGTKTVLDSKIVAIVFV